MLGNEVRTADYAHLSNLLQLDGALGLKDLGPQRGAWGLVEPSSAGNPTDLVMTFTQPGAKISVGDRVVTRGTEPEDRQQSLYPVGLPIGEVKRIDNAGTDTQEVHLRPFADLRSLDFVQILTKPRGPGS